MKTCKSFCILGIAALFLAAGCGLKKQQSTVSVIGVGTVLAQPDMVQMNISLSKVAQTTKEAQEAVSLMVRQSLQILKDSGIEDKNISTASLRFSPEYEWGGNRRILLGQKAEQSITFALTGINADTEKVSRVIDLLIQINGIELNQINFSVKDNTGLFVRSRELAYQKALEKANQYAELSGLTLIKALNISEEGSAPISPINNRLTNQMQLNYASSKFDAGAGSTELPTGELEITSRVLVEFLLK